MRTVEHRIPGLVTREHELEVPLDPWHAGDDRTITIFAREVADPDGLDKPYLLFLQGGPGGEATRPSAGAEPGPDWVGRALRDFRVLLLDQRGTGRSTPVGALPGMTAEQQAEYLTHFRADAIVADAEALRAALGSPPWSVLGQSFGGLCATRYLSAAPEGLREVIITGGLPPLDRDVTAAEVFELTYARMVERSLAYYARYPQDRERVLALHALTPPMTLPDGTALHGGWIRTLGANLGMSDGPDALHHLLELPFDSPAFAHDARAALPFDLRNPLYLVLHEACWAQGAATRWAAERVRPAVLDARPELFCAEHPQRWMLDGWPLREAALLLAEHEWPVLYDPDALAANDVPVAAAIYLDDPYVVRELSEPTASRIGALRAWRTDEHLHNGLRAEAAVLDHLIGLVRGRR